MVIFTFCHPVVLGSFPFLIRSLCTNEDIYRFLSVIRKNTVYKTRKLRYEKSWPLKNNALRMLISQKGILVVVWHFLNPFASVEQWSPQDSGSVEIICLLPAPASSSNKYFWSPKIFNAASFDDLFIIYLLLTLAGMIFRTMQCLQEYLKILQLFLLWHEWSVFRTFVLTVPGGITTINLCLLISAQDRPTLLIINSASIVREHNGEIIINFDLLLRQKSNICSFLVSSGILAMNQFIINDIIFIANSKEINSLGWEVLLHGHPWSPILLIN